MTTAPASRAEAFNRWLRALPTVNSKLLVSYGLAVLLVCTVCVCLAVGVIREKPVALDEGALAVVCGLITALAGVGHLDYKAQRNTWSKIAPPDETPADATPPDPVSAASPALPSAVAAHAYDPRA